MSSSDGPDGANLHTTQPPIERPARGVDSLLVETLIYVLIEKGVMTKNDALSVVQTVAEVTRGALNQGIGPEQADADLILLQRLFASFAALDDQSAGTNFDGENVHRLRPPVHGDRPQFPHDESSI